VNQSTFLPSLVMWKVGSPALSLYLPPSRHGRRGSEDLIVEFLGVRIELVGQLGIGGLGIFSTNRDGRDRPESKDGYGHPERGLVRITQRVSPSLFVALQHNRPRQP